MLLTAVEESLLLAAYYRGGSQDDSCWTANSDQILTLSLFYTGDISFDDCAKRFCQRGHLPVYDKDGKLTDEIEARYRVLIDLIRKAPDLIGGAGNFEIPTDPPYTACRLTDAGHAHALTLIRSFLRKPEFPNWPDKRPSPDVT